MRRLLATALMTGSLAAAAPAMAADPPVLAAAGDIACKPGATKDATHCHDMETSDLVISRAPDAVAVLGDNQYADGTLLEFQTVFGASWGRFLDLIHPVPGNHEYQDDPLAGGYYDYFGARAGERTKGYYSWNLGTWHLVALNSDCGDSGCDNTAQISSAQQAWLATDLAAHPTSCTLAYWHHPLRGDGNGGDNPAVKPLWDALHDSGADIVLNGHDHDYQRWAPMDPAGAADGDGPTQVVVGSGGKDFFSFTANPARAAFRDNTHFGVLFLTLSRARADWEWRGEDGAVLDSGGTWCHRPEAKATVTPAATAGTMAFDAAPSEDHFGKALTGYAWDFGDGASGTGATTAHSYAAPGTYAATLTVTNARGLQGRTPLTVTVPVETPAPPAPADPETTTITPVPAGVATLAAPRVFEAGLTRRSFRRGSSTVIRFRLSARASVRIVIQRRKRSRWTTVATFTRLTMPGRVRAAFSGRVGGRLLAPGAYRAWISAVDSAGRRSNTATAAFRIAAR